ncbi:nucleotidyltransferase family protein [Coleofasciculus sp. FACHB-712]|uniref:nucleotidyltransferase domain-containing protein n=1 Tax=Coleofasciculus sp. FACHB-712 TaxID=2692789 RepID=UPI00168585FD|nr:nucleotidyltransferase family protein [Coleofasciculus sp. FACHB-712]MBD1945757.1 nucleotidyltransferase family protein [Coleofasciculus sp. FACHB-712]
MQTLLAKASSVGTRPEIEVLLICASTRMELERVERLVTLLQENNIDWAELMQMATEHRVMPLLYWNLNSTCPEAVPKDILAKLRADFQTLTRRSLFLSGELVRLVNLFEAQGIPVLPFKGPVLAASAYGNLLRRQFWDLDILVQERDIERAKALFLSQGYQMKIERIEVTQEQEAAFVRSPHIHQFVREAAYPFRNHQKGVLVELHWGVMPKYFSFPIDSKELWDDLEPVSIAGTTVPNLSPENSLLTICGHGTKDCWTQLARICDVAELIRSHPQLDWVKLMQQASAKGGQRMLFLGLMLAHRLLGTALPDDVWQKIQADPAVELLAAEVCEQLFRSSDGFVKDGTTTRFHLKARERLIDRVRYSLKLAITPTTTDWLLLPLAEFPAFLYYLLRPLRLIGEQILKRFKLSKKNL